MIGLTSWVAPGFVAKLVASARFDPVHVGRFPWSETYTARGYGIYDEVQSRFKDPDDPFELAVIAAASIMQLSTEMSPIALVVSGEPGQAVTETHDAHNLLARVMPLPSGQALVIGGVTRVYQGNGNANPAWAPAITLAPATVTRGSTYGISGTQFNGLSQAAAVGDEFNAATNYPLVRITNAATAHVFYARTHGHSTMGGMDERIESTLPPVRRPKIVPRS